MPVLSIRRYLNECGTDSTNPILKVCTILLEGIARHAVSFDREEYREFHANLTKLTAELVNAQTPDDLIALARTACETLAVYNREVLRAHGAQTVELRCMIEMLSQTLITLAQAGGQSVEALQSIQKQLDGARQLTDIRLLRLRLGDSLKAISGEAKRQQELNAETLRLAERAAALAAAKLEQSENDRITGLPTAERAEQAISARLHSGSNSFAVVFSVERLSGVNLRYGIAAGDQLLNGFGQFVVANLSPLDEVFRWRGPNFAALLDRPGSLESVRVEIARFAMDCQERAIQIDGQTVKLPLSCKWTVLKLSEFPDPGEACRQIDRFVADPAQP